VAYFEIFGMSMSSENDGLETSEALNSDDEYELIKYLRKQDLIEANAAAIRERRSRVLRKEFLENLPDDFICVSPRFFYNNKYEIRLLISTNDLEGFMLLDMSPLRFNALPSIKLYKNGTIECETDEEIDSKRPYPSGREWQETVVRKAVRKQDKFRKIVFEAYSHQCAVCSVKDREVLRAAHIVPVVDGGEESISNGICLCANHEIAFDQGILMISPTGEISVRDGGSLNVECSKIRFPLDESHYPSPDNLAAKLEILKKEGKC
jgi:putative restriction endonuclease